MKQRGFTLIELLVAIGIILLLLGLGLVNYLSFNERQQLIQGAEQVREAIADAQNSARSGKLRGCNQLSSYRLVVNPLNVQVQSVCIGVGAQAAREFALPAGVTMSGSTLYISPLRGRVYSDDDLTTNSEPYEITLSNSRGTILITVAHSGAIQVGDITSP